MLGAARFSGILPPLEPSQAFQFSMTQLVAAGHLCGSVPRR